MSLPAGGERRKGVRGWKPNGPLTIITQGNSIVWQLPGVGEVAGHKEEEWLEQAGQLYTEGIGAWEWFVTTSLLIHLQ